MIMKGVNGVTVTGSACLSFSNWEITAVIRSHAPLNDIFSYSKVKLRWTSIKCFHDNSPVLLAAV